MAAKRKNNKSTGRDYTKQRKYNATREQTKKRVELNRYNRKKGTYGNGDGLDASHKGGKIRGFEKASKNRSRNGKGSTKKPKRK